jgi:alpha-glucosidase
LFTKISTIQFIRQSGRHLLWHGHDETGQIYTFIWTALGEKMTRIILKRGAHTDVDVYQIANGTQGTLPYHSWMVDTADEAWPEVKHPHPQREDALLRQFSASSTALRLVHPLRTREHIYGFGERTGTMDKRGQAFPVWNIDPPRHHNDNTVTMYVSIPFYLSLNEKTGNTHAVLIDHTGRVDVDLGKEQAREAHFTVEDETLAVYFFAGPTPATVLQQYSQLTGRMPLPPRWALGHHQCRWSYESAEVVRKIAQTLRTYRYPCDAIWLDIDYMDGYRNFTWNPNTFPEPRQLIAELREQGLRVVTIIDPGTKYADQQYAVFKEGDEQGYFCHYEDGSYFLGNVWPGPCVFPDYSRQQVREWWGNLYAPHLHLGVAGIWNDMNEPSLTRTNVLTSAGHVHSKTMDERVLHHGDSENSTEPDGGPTPHRLFHNAYGMQMARATYEGLLRLQPNTRPFVLSRSGTGGIQCYAAIWTGDNDGSWEHISLAIRMCLNLSMSGVPFVGIDIGGFWKDTTGELLVRFAQLAALMPFCRNHNSKFVRPQEPWVFGEPFASAYRSAIELRYRSLPYLYTLFAHASHSGEPIMRPLYYHYPQDKQAIQTEDEFLLGDTLLSAPIYEENISHRTVYLPPGLWFNYWTGETYTGQQTYQITAPLERWPLFIRANSILPQSPLMQYTDELPTDPLTIHCYMDTEGSASYTLYEDDGTSLQYRQGAFAETVIVCQMHASNATVEIEEHFTHYRPVRTCYDIIVHFNGKQTSKRIPAGQVNLHLVIKLN